ncbi:hypothetical protein FB107DRAFT_271596 [Schizophyllum commune]
MVVVRAASRGLCVVSGVRGLRREVKRALRKLARNFLDDVRTVRAAVRSSRCAGPKTPSTPPPPSRVPVTPTGFLPVCASCFLLPPGIVVPALPVERLAGLSERTLLSSGEPGVPSPARGLARWTDFQTSPTLVVPASQAAQRTLLRSPEHLDNLSAPVDPGARAWSPFYDSLPYYALH